MFRELGKKKPFALGLLAFLWTCGHSAYAADNYQVIDLGKLGGTKSEAFSINDSDAVVGISGGEEFSNHAFVYRDSQMSDLGSLVSDALPEGSSFAFGINNNEIAVGYSTETLVDGTGESVEVNVATYFDTSNQSINSLPQLDTDTPRESRGIAINNNNIMVGFARFDPPDDVDANGDPLAVPFDRGFFHDISSGVTSVVAPLDGEASQNITLRAILDDGFAVGASTQTVDDISTTQVFVTDYSDPTVVTRLDIFGGIFQHPWAVNADKRIVGAARTSDNRDIEAFLYDMQTNSAIGLGFLNENFRYSEAFDINDSDQIVGLSQFQNSPNVFHAFLYEDGEMKDLSKLIGCDTGWSLHEARAINNNGVITGTGVFEGERRAYMLMPIAGTAPSCEDESESSGSGSLPIIGLLGFIFLGWLRNRV